MIDVSVVIPTHERGSFVREAVQSVLAQSVRAEVIVVRSRGDTAAASLDEHFPGITVLECAGERGEARNAGYAAATGAWVLFLDDDDLLLPDALSALLRCTERHTADVVRGRRVVFDVGNPPSVVSTGTPAADRILERDDLITGAEILRPSQTLYRRAALPDPPFCEEFVPVEDYALGAAMALRGARVIATDATTTGYRSHAGQTVGSSLSPFALQQRRAVVDDLGAKLAHERALRRRLRAHHELYLRMPSELSNGHRVRALAAVMSAGGWWPGLLRESMWWRAAAHVIVRGSR